MFRAIVRQYHVHSYITVQRTVFASCIFADLDSVSETTVLFDVI